MIYFDNAANKPASLEALAELVEVEKEYAGNSNSVHIAGSLAHQKYLSLEERVFELLNLNKNEYDLIFTSGATESNNLAIKGIYESYSGFGNTLLSSEFEHSSTNAILAYLKDKGAKVILLPTNNDGKLSLEELMKSLNDDCLLLTLSLIESEVGTIQDYRTIQETLNGTSSKLLLDATQAIGKIPLNLNGIDMISFGVHKFGGISGTGILLKKKEIILTPLLHGGKAESPYRSGSFPLGLFASFVKALELSRAKEKENFLYVSSLSSYLREEMLKIEGMMLNSFEGNPYINNFSLKGVKGNEIVTYLSSKEICISQKSACSLPQTPSKVINSIYHDKQRALSSFRISLSENNTKEEIDILLEAIRDKYGK